MAHSEMLIILALTAILVLLRFYRRDRESGPADGTGGDFGPVRSRPKQGYGPPSKEH